MTVQNKKRNQIRLIKNWHIKLQNYDGKIVWKSYRANCPHSLKRKALNCIDVEKVLEYKEVENSQYKNI
jgi:transcription initiation factor TFIID subunit TAF12